MGSTFFGLILGVGVAAYIVVFQAETLNRYMAMLGPQGTAPLEVSSRPPAPALPPIAPQQDEALAEPEPLAPDPLTLRWAEYEAKASELSAVGEFRWRECFTRAAASYDIPEALLLAVASGESSFDPTARSRKGAIGLMQILWPDTGRHLGISREAELYDPCTNVDAGARYLAELRQRFDNDLHLTVAAYNYGPGRIGIGDMPQGARWYSDYIYQHLQQVLGQASDSVERLAARPQAAGGSVVLMTFNKYYRAWDFIHFLDSMVPGLELAHRSEGLGQHDVVLLYGDDSERGAALNAIRNTGFPTPAIEI